MNPKVITARELMTKRLVTVPPRMPLGELVENLRESGVHGALVQEGKRLVGVVSYTDVMTYLADQGEDGQPFWRALTDEEDPGRVHGVPGGFLEGTVEDAMTPAVISCDVNDSAGRVATLMQERGIHRAVVMENGQAVGVVSSTDLLRAVSEYEKELPDPAENLA